MLIYFRIFCFNVDSVIYKNLKIYIYLLFKVCLWLNINYLDWEIVVFVKYVVSFGGDREMVKKL